MELKKIHFTYNVDSKEGFISQIPMTTSLLADSSVEEIYGQNVLEKVDDLVAFVEECSRLLITGGKATFICPYYSSVAAWASPLTKRGIGEQSLNFASKDWREKNKFAERQVNCDFEVNGQFAIEESCLQRGDEVRAFWTNRYNNVVQALHLSLTKK